MRKLAFRYRRVKEMYNTYKNNVGGERAGARAGGGAHGPQRVCLPGPGAHPWTKGNSSRVDAVTHSPPVRRQAPRGPQTLAHPGQPSWRPLESTRTSSPPLWVWGRDDESCPCMITPPAPLRFSTSGPRTSSIRVTGRLLGNADSLAPTSDLSDQQLWGGPGPLYLDWPSR